MARNVIASDTFDSSIGAAWDNGPGDFGALTWVSGGLIEVAATGTDTAMRRNTGTYPRAQWSKAIIGVSTATESWPGATILHASGASDESCYIGNMVSAASSSGQKYLIYELNSSFGFTELGVAGNNTRPSSFSANDYVLLECDAAGEIDLYSVESGGAETLRLGVTDTTLTSGRPGLAQYTSGSASGGRITAWEGGDFSTGTTVSSPTATHTYTGIAPKVNAQVKPGAASHSYTGRVPTIVGTLRAPVATHTYTARAPQVKSMVRGAVATHSYLGRAPQAQAKVQPAAATHSYAGQAPKVNARVQPAAVTHTYTGRVPTVTAGNALSAPAANHSYLGRAPQVKAMVRSVVATHTYTGRVPVATAGASVQPGAATQAYVARAPKVNAQVKPGVATHSYTARTPGFVRRVAVPVSSHSYTGQAPKANVQVRAPVAAHVYTLIAPQVAEGEIALFGWGARNRIGAARASDRWQRIGSETATGGPGRIGSETATGMPGTIGSEDA